MLSETLHDAIHGDDDVVWNEGISGRSYSGNESLLFHAEDSWPICEREWNGNLSTLDLTVITEMAYALGQDDIAELTQQEMLCLYFDGLSPDSTYSEADCSWQIVFNSTNYPYFMHFRNARNATDVIAIRGTYSLQEMMQDFVLYNQVRPFVHSLSGSAMI